VLWLALLAAAPPTHLYHVDLSRAVVATVEGKALLERLETTRGEKQGILHAERERLLMRRGNLSEAAYAARVEELNGRIEAAERLLEAEQQRGLEPILAVMDQQLARLEELEPRARTVALADTKLIGPRRLCDRTAWLAEAFRAQAAKKPPVKPPPEIGACKVSALAVVRAAEAMAKTRIAKARSAALKALQDKRQSELDMARKEVTRLAAKARETKDARMATEAANQKKSLDAQFTRFQGELADAERAAETTLEGELEAAVTRAQKASPGLVVVELAAGAKAPAWAKQACDITEWVRALIDKEAEPEALPAGCATRGPGPK